VLAAVDWSNLAVAGGFIVGVVAGTIATIRVMRYVLDYLRHERDRDP